MGARASAATFKGRSLFGSAVEVRYRVHSGAALGRSETLRGSTIRSGLLVFVLATCLAGTVTGQAAAKSSRRVSLSIPATAEAGTTVIASGRVRRARHRARIVLQRRAGRHWLQLASAVVHSGHFRAGISLSSPGRLAIRAVLYVRRRRVAASAVRTLIVVARRFSPPPPPPPPSPSPWLTLPGTVVTYNDLALLTETSYVRGPNGGGPIYDLVGTHGGVTIPIDDRLGTPPSTTVEGLQSLLTPPMAGHPSGIAALVMRVTTPAIGIEPARSSAYYSLFDAATGTHILTSGPFEEGPLFEEPVAVVGESLRFVGCGSYVTIAPSGAVNKTPLPGSKGPEPENCTLRAVSAVINEQVLIYSQVEGCPTVYVTNVITEGTISHSPCLSANTVHDVPTPAPAPAALSGSDDWFFDGAAYAAPNEEKFFSATTGAVLEPEGTFALEHSDVLGGIRSSVALIDSDIGFAAGGPSYFVSTSSWLPVFTANNELGFRAFGIADNDAWVEGAAGRVVISTLTGTLLATGWNLFPEAGGAGWTLAAESNGACCDTEYLLRSSEPMLAVGAL
jgi:hypothetical protein